jgi:hypothetical protein
VQVVSGKLLGEPQMRGDYLVKDLLPPSGSRCLGLGEQLMRTLGQLFTAGMLVLREDRTRDDRKKGIGHERATLSK